jgi:hypothetical protein
MYELDLHGFRISEVVDAGVIDKVMQQCWEMGETEVKIIHGHGRNRGISPGFVNTNTGRLGLAIRSHIRHSPRVKQFVKISTLDCTDAGCTLIRLKPNVNPSRAELDSDLVPEPEFYSE